jgi:hypothetical protein
MECFGKSTDLYQYGLYCLQPANVIKALSFDFQRPLGIVLAGRYRKCSADREDGSNCLHPCCCRIRPKDGNPTEHQERSTADRERYGAKDQPPNVIGIFLDISPLFFWRHPYMKERPILFSAPIVRALLSSRKIPILLRNSNERND